MIDASPVFSDSTPSASTLLSFPLGLQRLKDQFALVAKFFKQFLSESWVSSKPRAAPPQQALLGNPFTQRCSTVPKAAEQMEDGIGVQGLINLSGDYDPNRNVNVRIVAKKLDKRWRSGSSETPHHFRVVPHYFPPHSAGFPCG